MGQEGKKIINLCPLFWDPPLTFSSLGMLDPVGQFGGEMETTS